MLTKRHIELTALDVYTLAFVRRTSMSSPLWKFWTLLTVRSFQLKFPEKWKNALILHRCCNPDRRIIGIWFSYAENYRYNPGNSWSRTSYHYNHDNNRIVPTAKFLIVCPTRDRNKSPKPKRCASNHYSEDWKISCSQEFVTASLCIALGRLAYNESSSKIKSLLFSAVLINRFILLTGMRC